MTQHFCHFCNIKSHCQNPLWFRFRFRLWFRPWSNRVLGAWVYHLKLIEVRWRDSSTGGTLRNTSELVRPLGTHLSKSRVWMFISGQRDSHLFLNHMSNFWVKQKQKQNKTKKKPSFPAKKTLWYLFLKAKKTLWCLRDPLHDDDSKLSPGGGRET